MRWSVFVYVFSTLKNIIQVVTYNCSYLWSSYLQWTKVLHTQKHTGTKFSSSPTTQFFRCAMKIFVNIFFWFYQHFTSWCCVHFGVFEPLEHRPQSQESKSQHKQIKITGFRDTKHDRNEERKREPKYQFKISLYCPSKMNIKLLNENKNV